MKILIVSSICTDALERLKLDHDVKMAINGSEEELRTAIADREALVFRSGVQINKQVLSCAPELRLLIRAGSGLDNLDFEYAQERGIKLVRIPEPGAQAVAELAFGMMINLAREICFNDRELRQGHWTKQKTTGYLLREKVLGIIGAGNIGCRVGEMGTAWGMQAVGCAENPSPEELQRIKACRIRLAGIEEVVRTADFLSIHVPKQPSTLNLINAELLALMKPNSFLVNLSRGGIVDESALLEALNSNHGPAGAGLDVHLHEGDGKISPLAALRNVVLTPHIGATTVDTMREIGERVIDTIEQYSRTPESVGESTTQATQ